MTRWITLYRVTVLGEPKGPWRKEREQAERDALELDLGSYDEWGFFWVSVPAHIQTRDVRSAPDRKAA